MRLACEIFSNPAHEVGGFLAKPDAKKCIDGERRVAKPGIAIIPIAAAADDFGEAGGGRCDDRAGGLEGKKFQDQRGPIHLFAPAPAIGAGRKPTLPELHGALKQFFGFGVRGRRIRAAILAPGSPKSKILGFTFREHQIQR